MLIHNSDIIRIFNQVADLLELSDANPFRVRAYRNAAMTVSDLSKNLTTMLEDGDDLSTLPGIGDDLAGKIAEIVETGTLKLLKNLKNEIPAELTELLEINQLGPKRVATLHQELGIDSLDDLAEAARQKKIHEVEGFGEKTEKTFLKEITRHKKQKRRTKLVEAEKLVVPLQAYLKETEGVKQVTLAGSFRRRRETVGDLDILVTCKKESPVRERFVTYEDVEEVIAEGKTRSSVRLRGGIQVDLRVVPQISYGAALYHFTGSKEHNIAVRKIAKEKELKINEYGVFRGGGDNEKRIAGENEEEVFASVDLPYIEPELREDRGEIDAARQGELPKLIELDDICGDLHVHTEATDGHASLEEMIEAARNLGYSYMAITEHSQAIAIAHGFDRKRLEQQIEEIDRISEKYSDFRILKGIEVDILKDGSLDLPDVVLNKLDFTVCSVHSQFNLSRDRQTERIIHAMDNPHFSILGHPSGRLINEREPYQIDMEKIIAAAKERSCFLELNAHPDRLDLTDHDCRMAREMEVKIAVSTDAHSAEGLKNMKYGIFQARRGWLSKNDVINTCKVPQLLKLLNR